MNHVDLFSGIGGFSLAAGWLGWETILHVEIDPAAQGVLRDHWPDVPIINDVHDLEAIVATITGRPVDLLTGGPPCQPVSLAGKRGGASDDRWLWPPALAVVERLRPRWCCFENPPGLATMGLPDIVASLARLGYDLPRDRDGCAVVPSIPVAAVGAPHRRQRLWILAHRSSEQVGPTGQSRGHILMGPLPAHRSSNGRGAGRQGRALAHGEGSDKPARLPANGDGSGWAHERERGLPQEPDAQPRLHADGRVRAGLPTDTTRFIPREQSDQAHPKPGGGNARTQPVGGDGNGHAGGAWWQTRPSVDAVVLRLPRGLAPVAARLVGNAVVPQVAYEVLRAIARLEETRR